MNLDQMTTNGCTKAMEACVARLRVIGWANADISHHAAELTARGVPVEVVGLAGLLSIPEVAQVLAMLRLVADPTAGAAAMAVLRLRI